MSSGAEAVSDWLAGHQNFESHSRHISRSDVEAQGLTVTRLEDDEPLQDLALSVFHAATHGLSGTPSVKIVESHTGRAFIKQHVVHPVPAIQFGVVPAAPGDACPAPAPDPPQEGT